MKRLVHPMVGKIREINVKVGQMITEDGQVFMIRDMKMENVVYVDSGLEGIFSFKAGSPADKEDPPWMICDGEGFGR